MILWLETLKLFIFGWQFLETTEYYLWNKFMFQCEKNDSQKLTPNTNVRNRKYFTKIFEPSELKHWRKKLVVHALSR